MAKKKNGKSVWEKIGVWAFIIGFVIALIVSIVSPLELSGGLAILLGILGLIVGLINIADSEVGLYLTASIAFILSAWALWNMITSLPFLKTFMSAIIVFVAPGALIVSFKALYQVARN